MRRNVKQRWEEGPEFASHLQRFPKDARGKVATGQSGSRAHQLAASRVKVDVHTRRRRRFDCPPGASADEDSA